MNKRINARDLVNYPVGTLFRTPDSYDTVYTLVAVRYASPRVSIDYTARYRSTMHLLGASTVFVEG